MSPNLSDCRAIRCQGSESPGKLVPLGPSYHILVSCGTVGRLELPKNVISTMQRPILARDYAYSSCIALEKDEAQKLDDER